MIFRKIAKLFPNQWLVWMYKKLPSDKLKNWLAYRAQAKFLVAVLGVITNEQGHVLLLNHHYRKEPWGMPSGWLEYEQPEQGLLREIMEETGLEVRLSGLVKTCFDRNPNRIDLFFRGTVVGGKFVPSDEITDILYCKVGDWPAGMSVQQRKVIEEILSEEV